jgi:hypothetical protein
MEDFILQDFTTVSFALIAGQPLTQGADAWMDVTMFEDVVLYIDVRGVMVNGTAANSLVIDIQTSPAQEETSFVSMFTENPAFNQVAQSGFVLTAGTVGPIPFLASFASVPLASYLRWQIPFQQSELGSLVATFRILGTGYSQGC